MKGSDSSKCTISEKKILSEKNIISEKKASEMFDSFESTMKKICKGYERSPGFYSGDVSIICASISSSLAEVKQYSTFYKVSNSSVEKEKLLSYAIETMQGISWLYHELSKSAILSNPVLVKLVSQQKRDIEKYVRNGFRGEWDYHDMGSSDLRKTFMDLESEIISVENRYAASRQVCNTLAVNIADTKGYIFSFDNPDHAYGEEGIILVANENMMFVKASMGRLVENFRGDLSPIRNIVDNVDLVMGYVKIKTKELEAIIAS